MVDIMKQKHVDASRELRLWIGQVIVPAVACGLLVLSDSKARDYLTNAKDKVKSKFKKK